MKRPLIISDELHRNAPDVHTSGPENTGYILLDLVIKCLRLRELLVANGWSVASVSPPSRDHFIQHYFVCHPTMAARRSIRDTWQ